MVSRKANVQELLSKLALEVYEFISESGPSVGDRERWVPAVYINEGLGLKLNPYPKDNPTQGPRGWLLGIIARMLEEKGVEGKYLEHRKDPQSKRSFYRSRI